METLTDPLDGQFYTQVLQLRGYATGAAADGYSGTRVTANLSNTCGAVVGVKVAQVVLPRPVMSILNVGYASTITFVNGADYYDCAVPTGFYTPASLVAFITAYLATIPALAGIVCLLGTDINKPDTYGRITFANQGGEYVNLILRESGPFPFQRELLLRALGYYTGMFDTLQLSPDDVRTAPRVSRPEPELIHLISSNINRLLIGNGTITNVPGGNGDNVKSLATLSWHAGQMTGLNGFYPEISQHKTWTAGSNLVSNINSGEFRERSQLYAIDISLVDERGAPVNFVNEPIFIEILLICQRTR